ncbi:hypothetical protein [Trinickia soli]|nr:hypothetical protein LMG24076_03269 [Trinickia soli]
MGDKPGDGMRAWAWRGWVSIVACMLFATAGGCAGASSRSMERPDYAQGVVWQPDDTHANPHGDWDALGVRDLLVQWTAVDDEALMPAAGLRTASRLPDWKRIGREPWAREVIVGLAGRFDESQARAGASRLAAQSLALASARWPVHVAGWYFPVEVDPTWKHAATLAPLLERLPKPLWISVYDNSNIGGAALAAWLDTWLPRDVGVFFQDGCGDYVRDPAVARGYADALAARLGAARVRIIAEAFRAMPGGGFRAANAGELKPQLEAYRGYRVYLFDGPHYVSPALVREVVKGAGG